MSFGKAGSIGLSNLAVSSAGNTAAQAAAAHAAAVHTAWANAAFMAAPMHAGAGAAAGTAAMHTVLAAVGTGVLAVGAVAGAVLVTRAAMNGMVTFSERLEAGEVAAERAREAVEAWDDAVLSVEARNARIRVLGVALRKAGGAGGDGDGGLPGPIIPGAMPVSFLRLWCEHVDQQLDQAEQKLAKLTSEAAMRTLPRMPGGPTLAGYVPPGDLRPCYAGTASRRAARPDHAAGLADRAAAESDALLATLPRDVAAEDYARALNAAAQARKAGQADKASLAEAWLQDLHTHVTSARQNAESRRADALAAAVYLSTLEAEAVDLAFPDVAPPPGDEALGHLRDRLKAVLAGEKLTDELRADAEDAMLTARRRAEDALVRAQLRSVLEDLKYDVSAAESAAGGLDITGQGLGDASVHVELSELGFAAQVQEGASGWDERRTDGWRQAWDEIRRKLTEAGLAVDVSEAPAASDTQTTTDAPAASGAPAVSVDAEPELDDEPEDRAVGRQLLHRERPS